MKPYESPWMDDDLRVLRDSVSRFVETEMMPHEPRWRQQKHVDRATWRVTGQAGFLLLDVPVEYGGGGGDFRHESILYEETARRGISGFGQGVHSIAAHYVLNYGSEEQKQRWLPRMASGELIGAIAMTEPGAGSDLKAIRTRAVRDGDDYVVNGSKMFITNGFVATILMLVVRTDPNDRSRGLSILMVETEGRQGYRVGKVLDKMGLTAQDTSELYFEDMRVPASCLLGGEEGKGMHMLMGDLPYERLTIALGGVAAMEGALEETAKYVKERQVFGQPVGAYQNTRFKLAEAATLARVARVFVDRCIEQLVAGTLDTETAAMAKWWVTDTQQKVIDDCQQLFGGYGYMNEYLICRMFTDSRVQRIYGGTNEIMKELISRSI
jgi:acyl-CoA dehydrogenase